MKTCKALLVAVLFTSACGAFADSAEYDYDLSGGLDIWQLDGTICGDDTMGCEITYSLTQDNVGKITGGGDIDCLIDGADVTGAFTVTGTITQKSGIVTVKIKVKISAMIDAGLGGTFPLKGTETITATINTTTDPMTIDGEVKFQKDPLADYVQDLPDDMNGASNLFMDVNSTNPPKNTKLAGDAVLALSNLDEYDFTIKGSYNANKELNKLTLTGIKDGSGKSPGSFTLVINDGNDTLNSLKGKSLGQALATSGIPDSNE